MNRALCGYVFLSVLVVLSGCYGTRMGARAAQEDLLARAVRLEQAGLLARAVQVARAVQLEQAARQEQAGLLEQGDPLVRAVRLARAVQLARAVRLAREAPAARVRAPPPGPLSSCMRPSARRPTASYPGCVSRGVG